jgi:hypothetical protein
LAVTRIVGFSIAEAGEAKSITALATGPATTRR